MPDFLECIALKRDLPDTEFLSRVGSAYFNGDITREEYIDLTHVSTYEEKMGFCAKGQHGCDKYWSDGICRCY